MRVLGDTFERLHQFRFVNAARGGGTESQDLLFWTARAEGMPAGIDALVITSDLQGVAPSWRHGGENTLLGILVAEELFDLANAGRIPEPSQTGVILAGDLYSAPAGNKRGASGDVREVWMAFAAMNRWVTGVAGNHDRFGTPREQARLAAEKTIELLDGSVVMRDGLSIGGVSYIIGNPEKPGRQDEGEFFAALDLVLEGGPKLTILHEGPCGQEREQRGNVQIRKRIESSSPTLVVCGHVHWDKPLAQLGDSQVLNVDSRVVVLTC